MEELALVRPLGCDFVLNAPARLAKSYTQRGFAPLTTSLFRLSSAWAEHVVDFGAQMGYFSILAATANPSARIVAVQASPHDADVLRDNARVNSCEHIEVVADNSVTGTDLSIAPGRRLLMRLAAESVDLTTLDSLAPAIRACAQARLLVELDPERLRQTQTTPTAIVEWLACHGFRVFALDDDKFTWHELHDTDAHHDVDDRRVNLWCLPRESTITLATVLHSAALSGAERSHVEVVADLVTQGCMVCTIMPSPDLGLVAELKNSGSGIRLVEKYGWWLDGATTDVSERPITSRAVRDAIAHLNPDVVMTQTMVVPHGALAALELDKPHVWNVCEFGDLDFDVKFPGSPREFGRLIRELSDVVLTMSHAVKRHLFSDNDEHVHVLAPNPWMHPTDIAVTSPQNDLTIGVVASLHEGKGHADIIRAIAHSTLRDLPIRLKFFGSGSEADRERLRQVAAECRVADQIEFVEHMTSRTDMYGSVDIVAVTSRSEAYGRVAFEATAAGRPVIYTRSGGIVEYMVAGETGLAYEPGDIDELARHVDLLLHDESLRQQFVAQATRRFDETFTDAALQTALRHHLSEAITRHASRSNESPARDRLLLHHALFLDRKLAETRIVLTESNEEREALRADRDALRVELDRLTAHLHEMTVERNHAVTEKEAVLNSRLWRSLSLYRRLRRAFRRRS